MNGGQAVFRCGSKSIQCLFRMAQGGSERRSSEAFHRAEGVGLGRCLPMAQNGSEGAEGAGCMVLQGEALAHAMYILNC